MKQGHTKGSAFAICTATFEKAGKPVYVGESENRKLHLFSESIRLKGNKVSGVCIHPKRIFHPEENMTHVYLREELEKAAPTLIGKPFGIDHIYVLPPPNLITNAWYDPAEDGVAFEGTIDNQIMEQVESKAFKGLSIELNWLRPGGKVEYANGVAPRNFELTSVHFLKNFPPGDKDAYIKFWNSIMEQLVVSPALTLDEKVARLEQRLQELSERIAILAGKFEVLSGIPQPSMHESASITNQPTMVAVREAEWDAAAVNDLPDSSFAVISKGGHKDEHGKTVPRALRHLPHHKADGSLDPPHLRNALARLLQTDLSSEDRAEAKRHLCGHAKESQIVSEVCGEEPPKQGESQALVGLRKQLVENQAKLAESQKRIVDLQQRYQKFYEAIKGTHPVLGVQRSWTRGPQMMIEAQLRVLRDFDPSGS